ncbi:MAG TPA: cation diffusion facilitator family transporter [Terriglobia bacterium]|nr:cation diffusion facilitator family transporter [Terriglobia bacterium]
MEHHGHHHSEGYGRSARGSLKLALIITSTFLVAEFIGALYTNSLALLADSGHMVTDVAALSLSLAATWFSTRRATPQKTFGFYRVEILAALLNGVFLILISLYIFYESWGRLTNPPEIKAGWMLVVALIGLFANLWSAYLLFGNRSDNLNIRGAFFHVMGDAVGSVGAVIAGLAILFGGYRIADPIISALVGVLILSSSWVLVRDAVDILLEGTPSHVNIVRLQEQLLEILGVGSVHDLHVWTLTSGVVAMSCHVVMANNSHSYSMVLAQVKDLAHDKFQIDHTTVQIEDASASEQVVGSCDCNLGAWHSVR